MLHASAEITDRAGVADGGEDGPAAAAALEVGEPAGFNCVPLVDAARGLARHCTAAQAGEYFVYRVHSNGFRFYYCGWESGFRPLLGYSV